MSHGLVTHPADATLLDGVRRSDVESLHELFRRHGSEVYASAVVVARRSGRDAADLTVEAFVSLFRSPPTVAATSALRELLVRVVRSVGDDARRAW